MAIWIGIQIGLLIGSLYLSYKLRPKPDFQAAKPEQFTGENLPANHDGSPVPIVYGTDRVKNVNVLWVGRVRTNPVPIGKPGTQPIGYEYQACFHIGVCLGGDNTIRRWKSVIAGEAPIWQGSLNADNLGTKVAVQHPNLWGGFRAGGGVFGAAGSASGGEPSPGRGGIVFFPGSFTQGRRGDLDPTQFYALEEHGTPGGFMTFYRGLMYMTLVDLVFGESPHLPPISAEVMVLPNALGNPEVGGVLGPDANPAEVLYHVLTNDWGRMGLDPELIDTDSFATAAQILDAENHGWSMTLGRSHEAANYLNELLNQIDGVLFEDPFTHKISLKLVREDYTVFELPHLVTNDLVRIEKFEATLWPDTYNQVRVSFIDRADGYSERSTIQQNSANFIKQGRWKTIELNYPGCKDADLARRLAARELRFHSVPSISAVLVFNRSALGLKHGDVFRWSYGPQNIQNMVMRVHDISYGELHNNEIKVTVSQDKFDNSLSPYAKPPLPVFGGEANPVVTIDDDNPPKTWEAPGFITGILEPVRLISDRNDSHLMYFLPKHDVNAAYQVTADDGNLERNEFFSYTPSAFLSEPLSITEPITDITITGVEDPNVLFSHTEEEAEQGKSLLLIDDEWLAYQGVTENFDGSYTLHNVWRGILDTPQTFHDNHSRVWFVNPYNFATDSVFLEGSSVEVKLVPTSGLRSALPTEVDSEVVEIRKRPILPYPPADPTLAVQPYFPHTGTLADFMEDVKQRELLSVIDSEVYYNFKLRSRNSEIIVPGTGGDQTPDGFRVIQRRHEEDVEWSAEQPVVAVPAFTQVNEMRSGPSRMLFNTVDGDRRSFMPPEILMNLRSYRRLIRNHRFEQGFFHWPGTAGTTPTFHSGSFGLGGHGGWMRGGAVASTQAIQEFNVSKLLPSTNGKKALLSFYHRNDNSDADDQLVMEVSGFDDQETLVNSASSGTITPSPNEWRFSSVLWTMGADIDKVQVKYTGTAQSDGEFPEVDASITKVDLRIADDISVDQIENGHFTGPLGLSWDTEGTWEIRDTPLDGLSPYSHGSSARCSSASGELSQEIEVPSSFNSPDVAWLSWAQGFSGEAGRAKAILEFYRSSDDVLIYEHESEFLGFEDLQSEDVWFEREIHVAVPWAEEGLYCIVRLIADRPSGTGDVFFDAVRMHFLKQEMHYPTNGQMVNNQMHSSRGMDHLWTFSASSGDEDDAIGDVSLSPINSPSQNFPLSIMGTTGVSFSAFSSAQEMRAQNSEQLDFEKQFSILLICSPVIHNTEVRSMLGKGDGGPGYSLITFPSNQIMATVSDGVSEVSVQTEIFDDEPSGILFTCDGEKVSLAIYQRGSIKVIEGSLGSEFGSMSNEEVFRFGSVLGNRSQYTLATAGISNSVLDYTHLRNIMESVGFERVPDSRLQLPDPVENLLSNGYLEDWSSGQLVDWNLQDGAYEQAIGYKGFGAKTESSETFFGIHQIIEEGFQEGETLRYRVKCLTDVAGGKVELIVNYRDTLITPVLGTDQDEITPSEGWDMLSFDGVIPTGTNYIEIDVVATAGSGRVITVDDVEVFKVEL